MAVTSSDNVNFELKPKLNFGIQRSSKTEDKYSDFDPSFVFQEQARFKANKRTAETSVKNVTIEDCGKAKLANANQNDHFFTSYPPDDSSFILLKDVLTPIEVEAMARHQKRIAQEAMKAKKSRENIWY